MRAAVYRTTGRARDVLCLEEVADPTPDDGEVRVRVRVSGVNPTDWKARSAPGPLAWPWKIPNQDGAGVIDSVGPGVDAARVGQRVWLYHAAYQRQGGTAAEYVCVPSKQAVPLPADISFEQGAGLAIPYMTASHCLRAGGMRDGRTVLVTGGAGAVGNAAIQLAHRSGARVIATVSSDEKGRLATRAGADLVLNYRRPSIEDDLAKAAPNGIDIVVDVAFERNLASYIRSMALRGHVSSYSTTATPTLTMPLERLRRRNITCHFIYVYELAESDIDHAVDQITAALTEEGLKPLPVATFALEDIAEAHDAVEGDFTGKVLIEIG